MSAMAQHKSDRAANHGKCAALQAQVIALPLAVQEHLFIVRCFVYCCHALCRDHWATSLQATELQASNAHLQSVSSQHSAELAAVLEQRLQTHLDLKASQRYFVCT